MLVETPDGEKLYVRQLHNDSSTSYDLAIFTSTGERVRDPILIDQVTEAVYAMSNRSEIDFMEMTG